MKNKKEANLISFKVVLTSEGQLVTELSELPIDKVEGIFSKLDRQVIKTLLQEAKTKLEPLHLHLQKEIQAL
jgi:hypothetical protein|tara:strand:- start:326 stop:541 length:216 start_codon:yes stop_codon:yes gene_type:complete